GRGLFDVLDVNKDGYLSLRELRNAWVRVKSMSSDGKALSEKDIRQRVTVTVGRGYSYYRARAVTTSGYGYSPAKGNLKGAPPWFTKMDRNKDGDIWMREWLGSLEDFDAMDADGDGLISVAEARRWEARQKKPKK